MFFLFKLSHLRVKRTLYFIKFLKDLKILNITTKASNHLILVLMKKILMPVIKYKDLYQSLLTINLS